MEKRQGQDQGPFEEMYETAYNLFPPPFPSLLLFTADLGSALKPNGNWKLYAGSEFQTALKDNWHSKELRKEQIPLTTNAQKRKFHRKEQIERTHFTAISSCSRGELLVCVGQRLQYFSEGWATCQEQPLQHRRVAVPLSVKHQGR